MSRRRVFVLTAAATVLAAAVAGVLVLGADDARTKKRTIAKLTAADVASRDASSSNAPAECGLPDGSSSLADANLGFAWRTFAPIDASRTNPHGNTTYSAFSASTALQMLANGADPGTDAELLAALCVRGTTVGELDLQVQRLLSSLDDARHGVDITTANAIWAVPPYEPSARLDDAVVHAFHGSVGTFPGVAGVNRWADRSSKGRVKKVITEQDVTDELVMVLANAVTFDGTWTNEFEEPDAGDFRTSDERTVAVRMLSDTRDLDWYGTSDPWEAGTDPATGGPAEPAADSGEFDAVRIPYGDDERFVMTLVVPRATQGLDAVLKQLDAARWREMQDGFEEREIILGMPEVELSGLRSIKEPLFELGVPEGTYDALMSKPPTDPTIIDFMKQGTSLQIDSKGTKAAAVTVIGASAGAGMPTGLPVVADHPYLVVIEDTETDTVLFQSAVRDPLAEEDDA